MKKINLEIVGDENTILEFIALCAKLDLLGSVGSSRTIPVFYDGDGSARLRFKCNVPGKNTDSDVELIQLWKDRHGYDFINNETAQNGVYINPHDIGG